MFVGAGASKVQSPSAGSLRSAWKTPRDGSSGDLAAVATSAAFDRSRVHARGFRFAEVVGCHATRDIKDGKKKQWRTSKKKGRNG